MVLCVVAVSHGVDALLCYQMVGSLAHSNTRQANVAKRARLSVTVSAALY